MIFYPRELIKVGNNSFAVLPQRLLMKFCTEKTPDEPFCVISITDFDNEYNPLVPESDNLKGVLYLRFDDDEPDKGVIHPKLFTEKQAEQVWSFVAEMITKDVKAWVIHCHAGICRSSAVAAAIATKLGDDPSSFFHSYIPNMWVFRKLTDTIVP